MLVVTANIKISYDKNEEIKFLTRTTYFYSRSSFERDVIEEPNIHPNDSIIKILNASMLYFYFYQIKININIKQNFCFV